MIFVLDACAMIAYLKGEPGASIVDSLLRDPSSQCYAHVVNLCEVYYDFIRRSDEKTARAAVRDLSADGVRQRRDLGQPFWQRVARLKARGGISLADCFCIALTQQLSGEAVTSDHREFDPLVPLGLCSIRFIR